MSHSFNENCLRNEIEITPSNYDVCSISNKQRMKMHLIESPAQIENENYQNHESATGPTEGSI